jgi:hypothetical protein
VSEDGLHWRERRGLIWSLRKDGFIYLEGSGDWGQFTTKPLTWLEPELTMNASAPGGEVRCRSLRATDEIEFPLAWGERNVRELLGRIVRVEVLLRQARLFAIRGRWHFIDAQDRWMIEDGKAVDLSVDL